MSTASPLAFRTGAISSKDGTTIGYRRVGDGPGVVLLHGGMQASQNLMRLANALSDGFTVYVPDRRGRGMSGSFSGDHGLGKEVEDLHALLGETGARFVFGLSAGALIALQAALSLPRITKLALYEPPLSSDGITSTSWVGRYERELTSGRLASAFVTVMKGTGDSTGIRLMPRFMLVPLMRLALRADQKTRQPGVVSIGDLIPTMRYESRTIMDAEGPLDRFGAVRCEVLLLGGAKSAAYLKAALAGLGAVLPHARRVTLPGVGHLAADDGGKPELVAAELRAFLTDAP
jgi:pimeloyl-ACP methyl ester carboxylesterase